MAKFPISKNIFKQSGFSLNFPHLSRISRTASNDPYTYGHGTTQLGKLNKYNQMEYIPAAGIGEEFLTVYNRHDINLIDTPSGDIPSGDIQPNYWLYGTNQFTFQLNEQCLSTLENGITDLYVVNTLKLDEFCETNTIDDEILESKRIIITNKNTDDYTWDNNGNIIIHHNFDGIVDYVLRYRNLQRIIIRDEIINTNDLLLYFPPQLSLFDEDYYELIIYKISEIPNKTNVFSYKIYNINDFIWEDSNCVIFNDLGTIVFDSILRSINTNRILFHSIIKSPTNITYILPKNYNSILTYICIYKSKLCQSISVTENNTENILWTTVDGNQSVIIKHNLNAIVNIILRNIDKEMFKYSDYIIDENTVQLIFPNTKNKIKQFTIDLYSIYKS